MSGTGDMGGRDGDAPALVADLVRGLWMELLDLPEIGSNDDFFALGGHSLSAMMLQGRLRQLLAIDVPLRQLFDHPTFEEFTAVVEQSLDAR